MNESKRAEEDRRHANEHRAKVYERIDELREDMHLKFTRTDESIAIAGKIAAQARDSVTTLKTEIDKEIKPQTDDFRRLRTMGSGFMLAVALAGGALGITFSDFLKAAFNGVKAALTGH